MVLDHLLYSDPPIHHDERFQTFLNKQLHIFIYRVYIARAFDAFGGSVRRLFPLFDFRTEQRCFNLDATTIFELSEAFDQLYSDKLNPYSSFRLAFVTGVEFRPEMSSALVIDEYFSIDVRDLTDERLANLPRDLPEADDWWAHLRPHNH